MNNIKACVARKYARAFINVFFNLLEEKDINVLTKIRIQLKRDPGLLLFLNLTSIPTKRRADYLKNLLSHRGLNGIWFDLVRSIAKHKRIKIFTQILFYIEQFYFEKIGLMHWDVSSACQLAQEDKIIIKNFLEKKSNMKAECRYIINHELIAGLRLQNQQFLWERSVRKSIRNLETIIRD